MYLNSGTEGSMPDCVISELQNGLERWASDPTTSYETDTTLGKRQEMNRSKVAEFLGVGLDNICLTDNTTMGLSMTLMGLNFRPGERVITTNHEHNAINSPLRVLQDRFGLQVEKRSFPAAEKLSGQTAVELIETLFPSAENLRGAKALCVSHIYPTTGVRLPLRALRRKADDLDVQYLIVDGAQALGMVDLASDVDNIAHSDFYACPGHKWLNGPPSTGVLYVRNEDIRPPEFYPTLSQRMENLVSCDDREKACYPVTKALQIRGCSNTPGFSAMVRAMKFTNEIGGPESVEKYNLGLANQVKKFLMSRSPHSLISPHTDPALLSGLTTFFPFSWDKPNELIDDRKVVDRVVAELLKNRIQVRSIGFDNSGSCVERTKASYAIRVSTGLFNTVEQVDLFARELQSVLVQL